MSYVFIMIEILRNKDEFDLYDTFSLSPNRKMIAYAKINKIGTSHLASSNIANGTPFPNIGSQLFVLDIDCGNSFLIAGQNSWRPSWSPDSNKLAYFSDVDGYPQVYIYEISNQTTIKANDVQVSVSYLKCINTAWLPNNATIIFPAKPTDSSFEKVTGNFASNQKNLCVKSYSTSKKAKSEIGAKSPFPSADIIMQNIETGEHSVLISDKDSSAPWSFSISSNANWLAYLPIPLFTPNPELYTSTLWIIKLNKAKATPIVVEEGILIAAAPLPLPILWVNEYALVYIKDNCLIRLMPCQTDMYKTIICQPKGFQLNPKIFLALSSEVIIVSGVKENEHSTTTKAVLVINIIENSIITEFNLDNYPEYTSINYCWYFEKTVYIVCKRVVDAKLVTLAFNISECQFCSEFIKIGASYCTLTNFRLITYQAGISHDSFISYYETPESPANLAILNSNLTLKKQLTFFNPELAKLLQYDLQVFYMKLTTRLGREIELNTCVLLPRGKQVNRAVMVVYPGQINSNYAGNFGITATPSGIDNHAFLEAGYAVILPDISWPTGYPNHIPLDEICSIILPQAIAVKQKLDLKYITAIGHSFGGYAVAGLLAKTDFFAKGIAISGIYDLIGAYGYRDKLVGTYCKLWIENGQLQFRGNPWQLKEVFEANSPYWLSSQINTPLLIIHGENDSCCPSSEAEKLYTALETLQKPAELVVYLNEEHILWYWNDDNYADVRNRIINFLDDHKNAF